MEVKMTECTRNNLCVDCDDEKCFLAGKIISDCPKYHCDRKGELFEDCESCAFIRRFQKDMRAKMGAEHER